MKWAEGLGQWMVSMVMMLNGGDFFK